MARGRLGLVVAAVCLLWVGFGLTGHEPWKPDEIYTVDLVLNIVRHGDWIVPQLAGEPFVEKPPIFFATAAAFAHAFDPLLLFHDAARLASGLYLAVTLVLIGAIAATFRLSRDDDSPLTAPLLFVACLGLFELAHRLQTDLALMCGVTLALLGLARAPREARAGGVLLGTGAGLAFMAKGFVGPALVGATTLTLLSSPAWRTRELARALGWAALAALPWLAIWPALLYRESPDQFRVWFLYDNVGRFFETPYSGYGPKAEPWFYTRTLPWFTWPAWPLALVALRRGRAALAEPRVQLPLAAVIAMTVLLALARDARYNYALPLLPPLALLASLGVEELRATGRRAWFWLGTAAASLAAFAIWTLWGGLLADVDAAPIDFLHEKFPGYVERFSPGAVAVAAAATLAWLALVAWSRRQRAAPALSWAGGMALVWILFTTLAVPAVDHDRSYRALFRDLQAHRQPGECVCSFALGEPERAMLDYYDGLVTERVESHPGSTCAEFVVQVGAEPSPIEDGVFTRANWRRSEPPPKALTSSRWKETWRGHRPGDRALTFVLYERAREPGPL